MGGQLVRFRRPFAQVNARFLHHGPVAAELDVVPQLRPDAPPVDGFKVVYLDQLVLDFPPLRLLHDGGGQGVL